MRKILIAALVATAPAMWAQNPSHIEFRNSETICFTPTQLTTGSDAIFHILQDGEINIYDNNLNLETSIETPQMCLPYLASRTRTRSVTAVVRTALQKGEERTSSVDTYCNNQQGVAFSSLTRNEQIETINEWIYSRYYENGFVAEECDEYTLLCINANPYEFFFRHQDYGKQYPKTGIMLTADGSVYDFTATYDYEYSAWSDFAEKHDTVVCEKPYLSCQYIDMRENIPVTPNFALTATLFNNDDALEYIRPLYTLTDGPVYEWVGEAYGDPAPITSDGKHYNKEAAIAGIEVVSQNGDVLKTISFEKEYKDIGNYLTFNLGGNVARVNLGDYVTIIKLGENIFLSFDTTENDEEGNDIVCKHFYKIDSVTNSVEAVAAPKVIKVLPTKEKGINVNFGNGNVSEVRVTSLAGQQCAKQSVEEGSSECTINTPLTQGTYIISVHENGKTVGTKKILINK